MENYLTTIYLADDDEDDIMFFRHALKKIGHGFSLNVASDGAEILEMVQNISTPPDIVLLDVNMPRLNGLEALRRLRELPLFRTTPIIIYSTSKSEADVRKALSGGANFYLIKPSDVESLQKMIAKLLTFDWKRFTFPDQLDKFILRA